MGMDLMLPTDTGLDPDDPASMFELLETGSAGGVRGALLTILTVVNGGPRAVGSHMAVLSDGRYCGYVSGGCIESVVATEAVSAISQGTDKVLRFGLGSPFLDIRLPCGGGLDIHIHIDPDPRLVRQARERLARRQTFAISYGPDIGAQLVDVGAAGTLHAAPAFTRTYYPATYLNLIGEGNEILALARVAKAAGLSMTIGLTSPELAPRLESLGDVMDLSIPGSLEALPADPFTATVLTLHDRIKEGPLLERLLPREGFYIGALGSRRTHAARLERLRSSGVPDDQIARLRGPIGLFGPTHDASSLALSVLSEITRTRQETIG